VRYTDDQKDFVANRLQAPPFSPTFIGQLSTSTDATDTSWDVSATWAASEDVNVYARIANGFRAPSIQGRLLFGDSISTADSETVLSREIGIKADLFEKRARVSLTAFDYTVYNQQLTAVGGAANFNQLINARRTEGRGFELDFDAYLGENLLVTWGTSLNDTEINDPNLFTQGCGGGCDVTDPEVPPGSGIYSIDGNRLPQAPKWIHNFTARYAVPLARGEFFAFTDWSYRGEINYFLYESAEFHGKPLLEGGLRVGYNWADGDREVAVFGRNITNEEQLIYGIDFNNLTGVVNEPRTFGVEFKGKF